MFSTIPDHNFYWVKIEEHRQSFALTRCLHVLASGISYRFHCIRSPWYAKLIADHIYMPKHLIVMVKSLTYLYCLLIASHYFYYIILLCMCNNDDLHKVDGVVCSTSISTCCCYCYISSCRKDGPHSYGQLAMAMIKL